MVVAVVPWQGQGGGRQHGERPLCVKEKSGEKNERKKRKRKEKKDEKGNRVNKSMCYIVVGHCSSQSDGGLGLGVKRPTVD